MPRLLKKHTALKWQKKYIGRDIDKIDDNEWEYITNVFENLTGKSLKLVDELFKNKQYDKVENLLRLVLQNHVDKLTNLLKA